MYKELDISEIEIMLCTAVFGWEVASIRDKVLAQEVRLEAKDRVGSDKKF